MRCNLHAIQPILDLRILSITSVPHLTFNIVKTPRIRIVYILRLHHATRIERVETDLSTPFPFRHVDLRWPSIDRCQPECRPRSFPSRSLETAREYETPTSGDGEMLFCENSAREVVYWDLVPAMGSGLLTRDFLRCECQCAWRGDDCVRWIHSGAAIVVSSPWVVVGEVLRQRRGRIEDRLWYKDGGRGEPGPECYR